MKAVLRQVGHGLRLAFVEGPRWVLNRPLVRAVLASPLVARLARWLLGPLAASFLTFATLRRFSVPRQDATILAGVAYVLALALFNSRSGRDLGEIVADLLAHTGRRFFLELVPGLFRLIMQVFARAVEAVERLIYAIDEWLRFRSGQSGVVLWAKAVLGLVWFLITYVVRFVVNLVAEPQLNPIKHFPVVTVSHKVTFSFLLAAHQAMLRPPISLGPDMAYVVTGLLQFIVPGICGFLVWEFKENWRLYQANRPLGLQPVVVGHHGETVARLLRPSFHSGTIPRLFARLRNADRTPPRPGRRAPRYKYREALRQVEHSVRNFLERDLLALLARTPTFADSNLAAGPITLGIAQFQADLIDPRQPDRPLRLAIEERAGGLVASIRAPGCLDGWDEDRRETFRNALAGYYKHAGIDLVREQIHAALGSEQSLLAITEEGLLVQSEHGTVLLPITDDEPLATPGGSPLVFARDSLLWTQWVRIWEHDRSAPGPAEPALPGVVLLPTECVCKTEDCPAISV